VPREYDSQLMESVGVRRRRLRDAVLFGTERGRHSLDELLAKVFAGIALAAVICAGCVGWAFIDREMAKEKEKQNPPVTVTQTPKPTETPTETPTGKPRKTPTGTAR
jgi:hypothetical protein